MQSVDSIAQTLTNIPLLEGGATVDPELLRQALIAGAQQSQQSPDDPTSLIPLIVRQLGLMQATPYDLFTDVQADQVQFDALQTFLILADIVLPTVAAEGPVDVSSSQLVAQSNGVLKAIPLDATDVCSTIPALVGKEVWPTGKWALAIAEKVGKFALRASMAIDIIHGEMLAFSVAVRPFEYGLDTHWGHESPGKALNFRTEVRMLDELPETLIKCGWILGVEFPKKGPIAGVTMIWYTPGLDAQGTITCDAACHQTNAEGVATLKFQPFKEADPGKGKLVEEVGTITSIALYQSKHNNLLGSVAQFVTPKYAVEAWAVDRHEQPGWDILLDGTLEVAATDSGTLQGTNKSFTSQSRESEHLTYKIHVSQDALGNPDNHSFTIDEASSVGNYHIAVQGWGARECTANWDDTWQKPKVPFKLIPAPGRPGFQMITFDHYQLGVPVVQGDSDCGSPNVGDMLRAYLAYLGSSDFGIVLEEWTTTMTADACDTVSGFHGHETCNGTINWKVTVTRSADDTP
jgi:hypothetical protein